jgi:hypothetical protein
MRRFIVLGILYALCGSVVASDEINSFAPGVTTAYAVIREVDGDVWYPVGEVFEAWGTSGRTAADYDLALSNKTAGMWVGDFDTNISAGVYHVVTHYQTGGSPADSDPAVWQEHGYWDGAIWGSDVVTALPTKEEIRAEIDANSTDLNTLVTYAQEWDPNFTLILADTSELQTDWTNGGRLDLLIDGIKAVTDIMEAVNSTVSTQQDANSFIIANTGDINDVNDAYNGMIVYVEDATTGDWEARLVDDWETGRIVTVDEDFTFTPEIGDIVVIWGVSYFPPRVYDALPQVHTPDTITIDRRASSAGGGTMTLTETGDDP